MASRSPAYNDGAVTVHLGDVRRVLARLGDASIDCCITSPPYWGLRDYGIPPQVWGGDPECPHRWIDQSAGDSRDRARLRDAGWPAKPRWLRDSPATCTRCRAWRGHLGMEPSPEVYVQHMVEVFCEVRRVLKPHGTLWLNLGDCYNAGTTAPRRPSLSRVGYWLTAGSLGDQRVNAVGLKAKDLVGIPWRVALGLQADGWYLRSDVIWAKPNPMPEAVSDRPTRAHEYVFLLSRSPRYFYDAEAIREPAAWRAGKTPAGWDTTPGSHGSIHRLGRADPNRVALVEGDQPIETRGGRNKRSVWTIPTQAYREAHFATFPERLVEPCIMAGTPEAGCCLSCGAPWRRLVEVAYSNPGNRQTNGPRSVERHRETAGFTVRLERVSTTTGWQPSCQCHAAAAPAVVLDPFAGAGTTLVVARRLGRHAIGIELNASYVELIKRRLAPQTRQAAPAAIASKAV